MIRQLTLIVWVIFLLSGVLCAENMSHVTVRTSSENNRNASVWYRVPENYREIAGCKWRTLVIFGGRNCGGSNEVSNAIGCKRLDSITTNIINGPYDDFLFRKYRQEVE